MTDLGPRIPAVVLLVAVALAPTAAPAQSSASAAPPLALGATKASQASHAPLGSLAAKDSRASQAPLASEASEASDAASGSGGGGGAPASPATVTPADLEALRTVALAHPHDIRALKAYLLPAAAQLRALVDQGRAREAVILGTSMDSVRPGLETTLYLRGLAYAQLKKWPEAEDDLKGARDKAGAKHKGNPDLDLALARVAIAVPDWDEAVRAFLDYRDHGGAMDAHMYAQLIDAQEHAHLLEDAIATFKEARARFPGNSEVAAFQERFQSAMKKEALESGMIEDPTTHFILRIQGKPLIKRQRDRIVGILEAAYDKVTGDTGRGPRDATPVAIYASQAAYTSGTGAPEWTAAHYDRVDGGIRMSRDSFLNGDAELHRVLTHEFTHLVLDDVTHRNIPVWLTEGMAQYESGEATIQGFDDLLRDALRPGQKIPTFQALEKSIDAGGTCEPKLGYGISWSMTRFIADRYGMGTLMGVMDKLGTGATFEKAMDKDYATLTQEWLEAERARLGIQ